MRLLFGLVLLLLVEFAFSVPHSRHHDSSEEYISKSRGRSGSYRTRYRDDSSEEYVRRSKPKEEPDSRESRKTLVSKNQKPAGGRNNEQVNLPL